ncbi:MAG: hypothetical protein NC344_05665 [Bacteroidales bacterium]|nr:hypothetical protein [Bacteroidales bacterium]MCM1147307.1 hypothetical protein [Bacteroidales bacterium]MCM1206259.1 hypothetical protein [Bacillota bacterium]
MNKEIKYNGYTASPSDYECPDGDLSVAINLVPEDGAVKPVFPPVIDKEAIGFTGTCVYIHKNSGYTHYIVQDGNAFSWYDKESKKTTSIGNVTKYIKVTSVGNTLIFLTENGMIYYLWKGGSTGYLLLGSKIPECPISFGLQGEVIRTDEFSISFDSISEGNIWNEFSDDNKTRITDQVLAKVNKFIAEESTNKGKFIFPFFVRYAYRLYDGSLTMHSSPVLMIASSDLAPQVFWSHITGKKNYTDAQLRVVAAVHTLDYAVVLPSRIELLKNWGDIVRSVDVFISKPIYTYDQNGKCTKFSNSESINSYCVCKHINQAASTTKFPLRYQKQTFNHLYAFTFDPTNLTYPAGRLMIPRRSVDAVKEDIRSTSQFYLLESIKVEQLTSTRTKLNIEEDYLQSLVTREVMTDDYDSHDTLIPYYSFTYNSRLNLSNIHKRLYGEYNAGAMMIHTNGYIANFSDAQPEAADGTSSVAVYYFIKQDGKDIIVQGESCAMARSHVPFVFLFYPNVNAYKAVIVQWDYFPTCYEVHLEQHGFLNGAFYFGGWDNPASGANLPSASSAANCTIELPNKIYTSEVNNPFVFPVLGINTVGAGEIKGICSAAKALSEGQFGQFPLYAFTTEGVWALEVSSTGTYTARQPITRDVCINPDSITQLDSSVLFATDRGIMLISGSQTQCISDSISSEFPFNALELPKFDKLHDMLGHDPITDKCLPTLPFTEFLTKCRMIYDYVHQRVIVYAPNITYAYVYSMKSKQWGMTFSSIASHLNSYPEALAIDNEKNIVNFSKTDASMVKGLLLSRPLKLDMPDIHKTIDTIIQRGHFHNGNVLSVLYGSRDLYNWHLVWSSQDHFLRGFRGTPYKYFRIACVTSLSEDENIFGASINFTERMANQLR